ncbi:ABC transporter substrate-binding protein [Roseobacter weihaiensis]|uniref:ABC transporter substrate-binding protein n=1 Tax=Roseobacter weihaiensis TaxID=2763262 RepID=UPI001D0A36FF|nr:ABC transporter substrate-binding protein [Roseobacter sp. H9]
MRLLESASVPIKSVLVGAVLALCMSTSTFAGDRVIFATTVPQNESNLFWGGTGERLPSFQALVGHDPITGKYDNSELAEEWSADETFTEWTFKLKQDAEFHYGWGPVTAADVLHSYELTTGPDSTINSLELLRAQSVEVIDDHTIVFKFDTPRTDYAFQHAGRGSLVIYSKAQYEAEGLEGYNTRPAGTAPYQYVERKPGVGVTFERVPDHWQGEQPDFEVLEIRYVQEQATILALLLSGEASIASIPRELQGQALDAGKKIISSKNPAMATGAIFNGMYGKSGDPAFNPDLPWSNVLVREAMNRALNRQEMIDVLYDGRAEPAVSWLMDSRNEGFVPELFDRFEEMYGYDPERAKALLEDAGYPDAFPDPVIPIVSSTLNGNPEFPVMSELLQVYFDAVGLQTKIVEMDWPTLGSMGRARESYMISPVRNAPLRPTEAALVNFHTERGTPYGGFEDDKIEGLANTLEATIDPEKRHAIAAEGFTYLFEQYADMPLATVHAEVAVDPAVVADWTFPGVTTNSVSHWHLIKSAQK